VNYIHYFNEQIIIIWVLVGIKLIVIPTYFRQLSIQSKINEDIRVFVE